MDWICRKDCVECYVIICGILENWLPMQPFVNMTRQQQDVFVGSLTVYHVYFTLVGLVELLVQSSLAPLKLSRHGCNHLLLRFTQLQGRYAYKIASIKQKCIILHVHLRNCTQHHHKM